MDEISNSQLLGPSNGKKVQRSASLSSTTSIIGLEAGATSTSLNSLRLSIPDYSYYISLGEFDERCVQDPAQCTQGYSLALWLKENGILNLAPDQYPYIMTTSSHNDLEATRGYNIRYAGEGWMLFRMVNTSIEYNVYFPFSSQTWNHLVITLPGNDERKLHECPKRLGLD